MARTPRLAAAVAASVVLFAGGSFERADAASGPLRVSAKNPRYFADRSGRPVYLTGSHTWPSLAGDHVWLPCSAPLRPFDYAQFLDRLVWNGHNFLRMWRIEHFSWNECNRQVEIAHHPWPRTGPGVAADGKPKFDLSRFDESYFARLRERVLMARSRGIYVSVMLFEGVLLQQAAPPWNKDGHPFTAANNVNGVEGDVNGDGSLTETHTLGVPATLAIQEAYVRKVVDTVNDLDNVLYEVANESGHYSTAWQYHMIRYVKRYEATKAKRHPVGMTFQHAHGNNGNLFRSPADWISPEGDDYLVDPPVGTGAKVILSDTDHHCGICAGGDFPWRSFMRGLNPIYMDPLVDESNMVAARSAMGQTRRYSRRIDLAAAVPSRRAASTGYALVVPRRRYLVYQPDSGRFTVDLRRARGRFAVEWFRPETDTTIRRRGARLGGRVRTFTPPFPGSAVLLLRALPRRR